MSTPKLLIIGTVFPEPNSSAAGARMLQLIALFLKQGWEVIFASAAADSAFMADLGSVGVKKVSIELNNTSFDTFLSELQPKAVMFDRFMTEEQFGWRVAEVCPDALRILDTEDLHCLRAARQNAWKHKRTFEFTDLFAEDVAKRELASILRCDLSLIISEVEMQILQTQFRIDSSLLCYLPFLLDELDENTIRNFKPYETREHFVSIGNFLHEPNWNAVQYLKEEIWPLIRKQLPKAELHVYGAYPSQKVMQLNKPEDGFIIKGRAEDSKAMIESARIMLAPLRFGAGLKGKLVEAMQCGTPSVTTSIGAEAMHGAMPWNGSIEDDSKAFAAAAVQMYTNSVAWNQAQQNGLLIIKERFANELHWKRFFSLLMEVDEKLSLHRKHNFIGQILLHHTISGTKYMAKWIEEKNK